MFFCICQFLIINFRASLIAQLVKNLPAMQETLAQFLGQEDPLEKGETTHSSILAWRQSRTRLSDFHFCQTLKVMAVTVNSSSISVDFSGLTGVQTREEKENSKMPHHRIQGRNELQERRHHQKEQHDVG